MPVLNSWDWVIEKWYVWTSTHKKIMYTYVSYDLFLSSELLQILKFALYLIQQLPVKTYKEYHLNRTHIPKQKPKDDVEVFQSTEIINKVPILNIFEVLPQTSFVENDKYDDDKIN